MTELQKGANVALPTGTLRITVKHGRCDTAPDVSAYLLGSAGKVSGDGDMVFYGQTSSGDGALRIEALPTAGASASSTTFALDGSRLRGGVDKIAFAAAFQDGGSFRGVSDLIVEATSDGRVVARFAAGAHATTERALILVEVYRRNAEWKLRAVAQGFDGGLGPLSEHFGVDVSDDAPPVPAPAPPPPTPTPRPGVNLSKITLDKARPGIDLSKEKVGSGEIGINLNWNKEPVAKAGGFFSRKVAVPGIDLDLGCLFEMRSGHKGAVQALGDSFGSYHDYPYLELSGDDRTGAASDGEWIKVNGARWSEIERLLVYAFIYEGVPNWSATDGVVTITVPGQPPVEVRLDGGGSGRGMCAIAEIKNVGGGMRLTRVVNYHAGHSEMDRAHRWGLNWRAGSKD